MAQSKKYFDSYYQKNKERILARISAHRKANKAKYNDRAKKRYAALSREEKLDISTKCRLKYKYRMTEQAYMSMYAHQSGLCAICKEYGHRLFVDHCHATNKVRSLLCQHCNSMIGFARESPDVLAAAIQYIMEHSK